MTHSKPLLMPWLRAQIDSQRFPGVSWTNAEQTEFSIPWKHALRQDSSDSDILIFKAWAEVTGNGRAVGDPSVWKRNFRSALRVKGFKMIVDNKNDTANPCKIFRWPDETAPTIPVDSPDILQACLNGLNIGPEAESSEPPPEQQLCVEEAVIGAHVLRGQPPYPLGYEGAVHGAGLPGQPAQPMEGAVGGSHDQQRVKQFLDTVTQTNDGSHFKTHFKVKVFYRGKLVSEQLIENELGLRLVYSPHLLGPTVDPDSGLTLVSLPGTESIRNKTQAELTKRILDSLGSVDMCALDHVVRGQRRGDTRAYWSFSNFDQSRRPQEVSKQPQSLYVFKDFLKGILDFINTNSTKSPPSSLFFFLGEKWPDPENNPWTKKLIMVEVVLTSIELLNQIAVEGGASSLQSVELQISLEEMMEMC